MNNIQLNQDNSNLYDAALSFVSNNLPNCSILSANAYSGSFKLPDGSEIHFIPANESGNEHHLRKSNAKHHILNYLKDMMSIESSELLKNNINKYVEDNY